MRFLGTVLRALQFPLRWLFSFLLVDVIVTSVAFLLCLLTSAGLSEILWSGKAPNLRLNFFGAFAHLPFTFGTDITSRLGLWVALAVVVYLTLANGLRLWHLGGRVKDWFLYRGAYETEEDEPPPASANSPWSNRNSTGDDFFARREANRDVKRSRGY